MEVHKAALRFAERLEHSEMMHILKGKIGLVEGQGKGEGEGGEGKEGEKAVAME